MPFSQDLLSSLRSLRSRPGFALGAILTLALGFWAALSVFGVVHGVLWKPLPYREPGRLVLLWERSAEYEGQLLPVSPAHFLDWREHVPLFEDVTAYSEGLRDVALVEGSEVVAVKAQSVFGNYFSVVGVEPALGRGLRAEESWAGHPPVVVLSDRLWRRLGADPGILGKKLLLDRFPYTVVGVQRASFGRPLADPDLWVPLKWRPTDRSAPFFHRGRSLRALARLRPGLSAGGARASFAPLARRLAGGEAGADSTSEAGLTPLQEWLTGERRRPLLLMLGAVGLVVLTACANVAHLQLARLSAREGELAVRSAIGASPGALLRLLLTESLVLSLAGGALGLPLSLWGERLLVFLSSDDPRIADPNAAVLAVGCAVVLLAGLGLGLATALLGARSALWGSSLRGATSAGPRSSRVRGVLVIAEMTMAVLLLTTAGLLLRSFYRLERVDPGFRPEHVLTGEISLPARPYGQGSRSSDFYQRLLQEVRLLPAVRSAALADGLPMLGLRWTSELVVEGHPRSGPPIELNHRVVSEDYFRTLGVAVRRGRPFTDSDRTPAPKVAIVNEALIRRCCGGGDLLGRRISFRREAGGDSGWMTVVGVVADEKLLGLAQKPWPEVFEPYLQDPQRAMALAVRSTLPPASLARGLEKVVRRLDPALPLANVRTLTDIVSGSLLRQRSLVVLLAGFAGIALALGAIGVFAVTSYRVSRTVREIGIRIALGASPRQVLHRVVGETMFLVILGLGLGLCGAAALSRILTGLLFEVSGLDPVTFGAVALGLAGVAAVASYLPTRRVIRLDPVRALRSVD